MPNQTFTSWWVENYMGWGEFRVPSTFPYPIAHQTQQEKLDEMNAKLARPSVRISTPPPQT